MHHPSAGTILIDTGMHPDVSDNRRRDFGLLMSLVFKGLVPAAEPYDEQLRALGIEPGEVSLAIMTHLHADHTSGMRLLPNAECLCTREEWAAARGPLAVRNGYVAKHLPPAPRMRLLDFGREGEPFGPFSRTVDLLGDGTIRLISTPGHSRGHLSVLVTLDADHQALLVGDAAYTLRSIEEQVLPLLTVDDGDATRSLSDIRAFARLVPEALIVPSHDPDAWRALWSVSRAA